MTELFRKGQEFKCFDAVLPRYRENNILLGYASFCTPCMQIEKNIVIKNHLRYDKWLSLAEVHF